MFNCLKVELLKRFKTENLHNIPVFMILKDNTEVLINKRIIQQRTTRPPAVIDLAVVKTV